MNTYAIRIGKRIDLRPWNFSGFLHWSLSIYLLSLKEIDREKTEKYFFLYVQTPYNRPWPLTYGAEITRVFCLLTKDYCLDKYEKDRMENDWEMVDHAHLHLIWPFDLDLWPLTLKLLSLRPLGNFYLHANFERDRIKNDRVIESESRWEKNNNNTQKTEQK